MIEHYYWVITQDFNDDPMDDHCHVGTMGGTGTDLTAEQVASHPDALEFRMRDELGAVLYHGFYLGDLRDEEAMREPLDLFGQHHGQCDRIAYKDLTMVGSWDVIL